MERAVVREFSEPAQIEVITDATPEPAPGEVLIEVEAAGVSFVDNLIAKGRYQIRPPLPYTPGSTAAGRVVAVGAGVDSRASATPWPPCSPRTAVSPHTSSWAREPSCRYRTRSQPRSRRRRSRTTAPCCTRSPAA